MATSLGSTSLLVISEVNSILMVNSVTVTPSAATSPRTSLAATNTLLNGCFTSAMVNSVSVSAQNANSTYSAANMCWHELDLMGCGFVMPGNYNVNGTFESCEADVAYPPGWYPTTTINGTPEFSTFAQRFTGTLPGGSVYTVGDLSTPASAFATPSSSNCVTQPTISNGVALVSLGITGGAASGSGVGASGPAATGGAAGTASGQSQSSSTSGQQGSGAASMKNTQAGSLMMFGMISAIGAGAVYLFH